MEATITKVKNLGDHVLSDDLGKHEIDFDLRMLNNDMKIKVIGNATIEIKAEGDLFVPSIEVMDHGLFIFNEERKIGMFNTDLTYKLLDELVETHCIK